MGDSVVSYAGEAKLTGVPEQARPTWARRVPVGR
jgi:hypothetical protein